MADGTNSRGQSSCAWVLFRQVSYRLRLVEARSEWLHEGVSNPVPVVPILYVKTGCGWCDEVMEYLDGRKLAYRKVVVSGDPAAFKEMLELSGQSRSPTMNWDGDVLADFGVEELREFLAERDLE